MPAKRSSSGSALSWILAVILISVAAVGVGWLIGQQVLGWINPNRSSVSEQGSEDTGGYSYYPWSGSGGGGGGRFYKSHAAPRRKRGEDKSGAGQLYKKKKK